MAILEGVYPNLSSEEYHQDKNSISRSGLIDFQKSPFHYWAKHLNPNRPQQEVTPAMQLGSLVHTLILEPHLFWDEYQVLPIPVLLKDVGRQAYDAYKATCEAMEQSGKPIIKTSDYLHALDIAQVFNSNPRAKELIEGAEIEKSFFWRDPLSGLMLKAKPDILHKNMIVDLKSCADASPRAFQNAIVQSGYHVQAAMVRAAVDQLEGRRIDNVIFIAIETKYPYAMGIYVLDECALEVGHQKYQELAVSLAQAMIDNRWDDYGTQTLSLPKWAI
jgi:hypothetical protein